MEVFIFAGLIVFIGLFFLMSLPIHDEWARVEADTRQTKQKS